jgi:hypothetical protein
MGPLIGIILTILACLAATGMWGYTLQIIAIVCLGLACVISDVKSIENGDK